MNLPLDLALLMVRQAGIHNGSNPLPFEAVGGLQSWMAKHGKKPGDDCTEYFAELRK